MRKIKIIMLLITLIILPKYTTYGMIDNDSSGFTTPEAMSPMPFSRSAPSPEMHAEGYPWLMHIFGTPTIEEALSATLCLKNGTQHLASFLCNSIESEYQLAVNKLTQEYTTKSLPSKHMISLSLRLNNLTPQPFLTLLTHRYGQELRSIEDIFTCLHQNPNVDIRSELIEVLFEETEKDLLSASQIRSLLSMLNISEAEKILPILFSRHLSGSLSVNDLISFIPSFDYMHDIKLKLIDFLLECPSKGKLTTDQVILLLIQSDNQKALVLLSERYQQGSLNMNQLITLTSRLKFIPDSNTDTRSKFVKSLVEETEAGNLSAPQIKTLLSRLKDPEAQRFVPILRILYKQRKLSIDDILSFTFCLNFMPTITTSAKSQLVSFLLEDDQKSRLSGAQILSLFAGHLNFFERQKFIPILGKMINTKLLFLADILEFLFTIEDDSISELILALLEPTKDGALSQSQISLFLQYLENTEDQSLHSWIEKYHQGSFSIEYMILFLPHLKWMPPFRSPIIRLLYQEAAKGHLISKHIGLLFPILDQEEFQKFQLFLK